MLCEPIEFYSLNRFTLEIGNIKVSTVYWDHNETIRSIPVSHSSSHTRYFIKTSDFNPTKFDFESSINKIR